MKNKITYLLIILFLVGIKQQAVAQKIDWSLDAFGFFDNQEYHSEHHIDQTMAGMWITPEIGVKWDRKHQIRLGIGGLTEWGSEDLLDKGVVTAYYQYSGKPMHFVIGSFPRKMLWGEYPNALIYDSIYYYRPNIQGFAFQSGKQDRYVELFLDWTSRQTIQKREQFMAGGSGRYTIGHFYGGFQGYYYHYAKTKDAPQTMFIQDYAIANVFVGIDLSHQWSLDSLVLQVGPMMGVERNRGIGEWKRPVGFFAEFRLEWNRWLFEDTFYAGKGQQQFGNNGMGKYYWNDAYYRSKTYNRTDFSYQFIKNRYVEGAIAFVFHHDGKVMDWQQKVMLRAHLGNTFHKRKREL